MTLSLGEVNIKRNLSKAFDQEKTQIKTGHGIALTRIPSRLFVQN